MPLIPNLSGLISYLKEMYIFIEKRQLQLLENFCEILSLHCEMYIWKTFSILNIYFHLFNVNFGGETFLPVAIYY